MWVSSRGTDTVVGSEKDWYGMGEDVACAGKRRWKGGGPEKYLTEQAKIRAYMEQTKCIGTRTGRGKR